MQQKPQSDQNPLPTPRSAADLARLLRRELDMVMRNPAHTLDPHRRLLIYDALGPTYAFPSGQQRVEQIRQGALLLTRGDRMRARAALLAARRVLPIWDSEIAQSPVATPVEVEQDIRSMLETIAQYDLPEPTLPLFQALLPSRPQPVNYQQIRILAQEHQPHLKAAQALLLDELIGGAIQAQAAPSGRQLRLPLDPRLLAKRLVAGRTFFGAFRTELPQYACDLVDAVLRGDADPSASLEESGTFQQVLGNTFGWDNLEQEVSIRALDSAAAAGEALHQALGFHPFSGVCAAATPAVRAAAGEIEDSDQGGSFSLDPQRQLRFWTWWLTEAIPQAYEGEALAEDAAMPTVPFIQTVRDLPPASAAYA